MTENTAQQEPKRLILLQGAVNFRDLGGYPTVDNKTVRWRTLFRSDGLAALTQGDLEILKELDISAILDLRSSSEAHRDSFAVDVFPVSYHHLPLVEELIDPNSYNVEPGMLFFQYQEFVRYGAPQIAKALSVIADRTNHPMVVHCTAGKDRTGIVVAVLLSLLGVPDDVIVADYVLSAEAMPALRALLIERYPESRLIISEVDEIFSVKAENMVQFLELLRQEYGSVEDFVLQAGLDPTDIDNLRQSLLQ